ncbi:MAG: hypothetical protein JW864_07820, partial [Spirochaetes bacterium]|nr:hypothetical protein [Spirochaetota bacterium]
MKRKTFIIIFLLFISISGCDSNNIWDFNPGGNNDDPTVLPDVTMTSIKAGSGKIDMTWIDPAGTEFNTINVLCTVTSTSAEFSAAEFLPGDQACSITGVTDNTEYTVTVTVTDSRGNSSTGISMDITPQAGTVEGHFIYTAADLNAVRGGVAGYDDWTLDDTYYLMADVDLSGYSSGDGWLPVGDSITPFTGSFEGNSHTISNL